MSKERPHRQDISLTSIYRAAQQPTASSSVRFFNQHLNKASTKEIDYTLRKLLSYVKHNNEQWPQKRLVRCLDCIYLHAIKPHVQERVSLPSFKACVRWTVAMLADTADMNNNNNDDPMSLQIQCATKFICGLLEDLAAAVATQPSPDAEAATTTIMAEIRHHHGVKSLLARTHDCPLPIRIYSVRALTSQIRCFAKDMIALNAYETLSQSLSNIPHLELDQCVMVCRLLESLFKYEVPSRPSPARQQFAASEAFHQLLSVWQAACHHDYASLVDDATPVGSSSSSSIKRQRVLVYSLTSIVQKCALTASGLIAEETSRAKWQPLLALCMQRWIRGTCCTMNKAIFTSAMLDQDKSIMKKLVQISLDILPVLKQHNYWLDYVDQAVCDLTNFFMAYVSQPILPEQASLVGTQSTLLHTNLCIDVEERGYQIDGAMLNQHQDLFVLLLESFIQHVQLATPSFVKMISGRVAWCLKSILTILLNANQLETSALRSRILKLIVFFLHYDDAIHSFATSSTNIASLVWGPTIDTAKQGLLTAVSLSKSQALTAEQSVAIYKAKRAFVSLAMISKHPRACERLVDCQVLQLVDVSLIPAGDIIEKTASLLSVYALFGQFVAALSRRTAFVRTKLRDECNLIPMIMKLLQEAVQLKEAKRDMTCTVSKDNNQDAIAKGWNHVIASCLMVISTFQYDEPSMRIDMAVLMEEYTVAANAPKRLSILPILLSVLFPWRNHTDSKVNFAEINTFLKADLQVILLASQLLDQLSVIPICGRQMIVDPTALYNLCSLMICLTAAYLQEDAEMADTAILDNVHLDLDGQQEAVHRPQEPPTLCCAEHLRRAAVRILITHDNIQFTMLSDAFTSFFQPVLQHPVRGTSHEYWRRLVCDDLFEKKMGDFLSLFRFTETADNAIKLHEMAAIAVGYAAMGAPTELEWNQSLGLVSLDGCIVGSTQPFGIFCQMLVYELEYEEEAEEEEKDTPRADALLSMITPFRRHAAAQVLEALALEFEVVWKVETESIREHITLPQHMPLDQPAEMVTFVTDDATSTTPTISGNRQLLRARSPIFDALLSTDYAESVLAAIPLHDVTFHSLELFISVIHQLNDKAEMTTGGHLLVDKVLAPSTSWNDIVDLLLISDRFGSTVVKSLCEHWILEQSISHLSSIRTIILATVSLTSTIYGHPLSQYTNQEVAVEEPEVDYGSAEFYEKLVVIMILVLTGGAFAGLTLGLMGMDETNLHVLIQSGTESEKKYAKQVLKLLSRGKHWVLVTLLLSNVIVNETLPIILDSVLGGGWKAVVMSTALIVIFGEVIPQSICVRYGLAIGAKASGMVLALMYIMYPIAYPTALMLDFFLGESHGTIYKKAGLKTLVSLHKSVNPTDVDALTEDEVTIIGAVLDLRSKPVSQIMTPIADVFTLSTEAILDEELVDRILLAGYSRIPVHVPGDNVNFVGMLLTKRLITYDPEDALPVKDLHISTLPETGPDTSCLDILNFFQEGKSHMALISENPGAHSGALGVITLEDVIEELIGEEIIDETDVYVDGKPDLHSF
ncbi:hypothetical protein FB192DRAFT_1277127 [Mucor lusitanicus]|uniref:DUF21-domain-containing protein n=2 Tax=Mucor circinelloides f. lusitanicus TaxID=29924 RepID=A0A8H4F2I3_MUCCL|nr:hypothetical protein FB192DRAFT_1277127 [Mucor lusitanicus]